ncbi:MAG: class I adenylate cyclase, partial [Thermodesulfobacteriota bacterium]|nr:class I adenylate cyclase [Thermodesulfobacteriota bacterium]
GTLGAFNRNNTSRVREIQRYGAYGFRQVFKLIPILIQMNHPDIPGYIEDELTPRGIYGFERSDFVPLASQSFPSLRGEFSRAVITSRPIVESLLLIGSSGSVGHTAASDLDYWVCFDQTKTTPESFELFQKKLDLISKWAFNAHSTEVNFYPVELADLASNRLQQHGEETEGEVAPLLLKEEFYRTVLLVLGRVPWWWAMPSGVNVKQYHKLLGFLKKQPQTDLGPTEFIDLGFPQQPVPQEYMSAALWLSRKSEADPFKGTLKMILILEQVESNLQALPLCDMIKKAIVSAPKNELPIDPYILTISRVLDFSQKNLDPKALGLVRLSAYYKIRGPFTPQSGTDTRKVRLLDELASEWGWPVSRVKHANNYSSWPERQRLALGQRMKSLLFYLYSRIAKRLLADYPGRVTADISNLTQFKAGILSRYSDHEAKVEDLPSSMHRKTIPKTITLLFNQGLWRLYGGRMEIWQIDSKESQTALIYECSRAARAAAWLNHNRLSGPSLKLRLRPRPGPISLEAMLEILDTLNKIFPPLDFKKLKDEGGWQYGGKGPRLVILNLEESWREGKVLSADLVYRTAWGEMRHTPLVCDPEKAEAEKYLLLAEQVAESGQVILEDVSLFVPSGAVGRKMQNNLKAALAQTLGSVALSTTGHKSRLDTD